MYIENRVASNLDNHIWTVIGLPIKSGGTLRPGRCLQGDAAAHQIRRDTETPEARQPR